MDLIKKPWLQYYPESAEKNINVGVHKNIYNFMSELNRENQKNSALQYAGQSITYEEMFGKITNYAKAFQKYGIKKGDVVSLFLPNIPETIYIKYALNRLGAIVNMIDPRTNPERIKECVNDTNSVLLISVMDLCKEKIDPIYNELKVENIITITPVNSLSISSAKMFAAKALYAYKQFNHEMYEKSLKHDKYIDIGEFLKYGLKSSGNLDSIYEENDPFSIIRTSGTSGTSKGVVLTNESYNVIHNQMKYGTRNTKPGDTFLGIIPFFSAYGSVGGMHNTLCSSWDLILIPKFNPNEFDILIDKYKPNNVLGVPRFYETFLNSEVLKDSDLSYLKNPVTGGDKISPALLEEINKFFADHNCNSKLNVGYGATEFAGGISITLNDRAYEPGSAGTFVPGCSGIIINPDTMEELPLEEDGEICINCPSMMLGYHNQQAETEAITYYGNDGKKYYRTGDMGHIRNGILYIVDRYKRAMMRPDGHTVHASPIEDVIISHNNVDNCCVVGIKQPGKSSGVIPTAFVVLNEKECNIEEIIDEVDKLCLEKLPERDKALAYCIVDSLPLTLMSKIDYKLLEKTDFNSMDFIIKDYSFFPDLNLPKTRVLK